MNSKCKVCRNEVGVWVDNGVKKLKAHMRRDGNKTVLCTGTDDVVK